MSIKARFSVDFDGFSLDVALEFPSRAVTTLFGPSGSGKSTFLRCIAGLERRAVGYLQVGDEVWQDDARKVFLPPQQRSLGYIFQEPRLFAHLSVEKNLRYGYNRTPADERCIEWDKVIEMLDIGHLLSRKPARLSGGEQQRIAIGRALLASPRLLLMDEPLASLDIARKQEVLPFIRRLHDELNIPVIYVSHLLQEILQITDTMVLLRGGRSVAVGPITRICSELELSKYLGDMSGAVIETTVEAHEESFALTRLHFHGGKIFVPKQPFPLGSRQRLHILALNVGIALQKPQDTTSFLNILQATVIEVAIPEADSHVVQVKLDVGTPLLASISRKSLHILDLRAGQKCYARIKAVSLIF